MPPDIDSNEPGLSSLRLKKQANLARFLNLFWSTEKLNFRFSFERKLPNLAIASPK